MQDATEQRTIYGERHKQLTDMIPSMTSSQKVIAKAAIQYGYSQGLEESNETITRTAVLNTDIMTLTDIALEFGRTTRFLYDTCKSNNMPITASDFEYVYKKILDSL